MCGRLEVGVFFDFDVLIAGILSSGHKNFTAPPWVLRELSRVTETKLRK
jgi:hypothetical protein